MVELSHNIFHAKMKNFYEFKPFRWANISVKYRCAIAFILKSLKKRFLSTSKKSEPKFFQIKIFSAKTTLCPKFPDSNKSDRVASETHFRITWSDTENPMAKNVTGSDKTIWLLWSYLFGFSGLFISLMPLVCEARIGRKKNHIGSNRWGITVETKLDRMRSQDCTISTVLDRIVSAEMYSLTIPILLSLCQLTRIESSFENNDNGSYQIDRLIFFFKP